MPTYHSIHYLKLTAVMTLALIMPAIALPVNTTIATTQPQNSTSPISNLSGKIQELGAWEPTVDTFINLGGFVLDAVLKGIQIYFAKEQLKAFLRGKSVILLFVKGGGADHLGRVEEVGRWLLGLRTERKMFERLTRRLGR